LACIAARLLDDVIPGLLNRGLRIGLGIAGIIFLSAGLVFLLRWRKITSGK